MSLPHISDIEKLVYQNIHNNPIPQNKIITSNSGENFFLKYGVFSTTYRNEANGLKELKKVKVFRIPEVILVNDNFILTEYIESTFPDNNFFEYFGYQYAKLHRYKGATFGFYENNFIGKNPQLNLPEKEEEKDWVTFYFNKRLLYQFKLAEKNGYVFSTLRKNFLKIESKIERIFQGGENIPVLLHGDLWSGNFLCDKYKKPVLIDPAVYYGNREADLAMTKLFGGFPSTFYNAYMEENPLPDGWEYRENIYKLYHILNHLNLLGSSYLREVQWIIEQYI